MRKLLASLSLAAVAVFAQSASVSNTTRVDINGNRVSDGPAVITSKTATATQVTETTQSINGRTVPLERVEERVLREDASGKVVERLIRRYDQQGNPLPPVREHIDEQKRPDGSSVTTATTYRGDINGNMQLAEKAVTESRKSGAEERAETVIQRPTINGALDTVEKQAQVKIADPNGYKAESTTYRRGEGGGFYPAVRKVTDHTEKGSESTENTVEYEANPDSALQLHSQTVAKTVTASDGGKATVLNIYGASVPGTVNGPGSGMQLQEQQLIDSQKGRNDTVTQTFSVRRPTISDPNTLGPAKQISQTVCKGNCKP